MKMQISLTPAESKKLISKSLLKLEFFEKALKEGLILIHPSSTTYFLYEELTKERPPKNWVCGVITPKGACINRNMLEILAEKGVTGDIGRFDQFWVFKKGKLVRRTPPLVELLEIMEKGDVYVKTGNAIDLNKNVGVLIGAPDGKGTVGRILETSKKKGFRVLLPIGLEKLVMSVEEAAKIANPTELKYSMGMPVYLFPVQGHVVTEIEAISLLCDARATLIASGGLNGAEGSITLVVEGERDELESLKDVILSIKGAKIPQFPVPKCDNCSWKTCFQYDFQNLSKFDG